jgi:hypothetical protein
MWPVRGPYPNAPWWTPITPTPQQGMGALSSTGRLMLGVLFVGALGYGIYRLTRRVREDIAEAKEKRRAARASAEWRARLDAWEAEAKRLWGAKALPKLFPPSGYWVDDQFFADEPIYSYGVWLDEFKKDGSKDFMIGSVELDWNEDPNRWFAEVNTGMYGEQERLRKSFASPQEALEALIRRAEKDKLPERLHAEAEAIIRDYGPEEARRMWGWDVAA